MDDASEDLTHESDKQLTRAMKGQEQIGWIEFCQGFYHQGWSKMQQNYYQRNGLKNKFLNIGRWKKTISKILGDYSLDY